MIVYIEDCLIENFVVTFLIIKCVCACLKNKISLQKMFCACFVGAFVATFYPLLKISFLLQVLFKLVVGVLICLVAFNTKNFLAKYLLFIFFTAVYAGLNIMTYYIFCGTVDIMENYPTYILLGLLLLIYFGVMQCIKYVQKRMTLNNFVYSVKLTHKDTTIVATAFLDSGNTLLDEDYSPIFIINSKLFNKLYKDITFEDLLTKNYKDLINPHYVKSNFASGGANILVFCVDNLQIIKKDGENIVVNNAKLGISYSKFSKNFNCDMLLNICAFV